jgi:hypothetical protein
MSFKIVNGRWVNQNNERLNPVEAVEFESSLLRVRYFVGDKQLSHDKIDVLMDVLNSDEETDKTLSFVVNNKQLSKKLIFN